MKCSEIKSSNLKSIIRIQNLVKIINEYGIEEITWVDKYTTRGFIKQTGSKKAEFLQGQGVNVLDIKDLIIRYCDVLESDTVTYKNNQYKIIKIDNIEEKNKYLLLTLERLKNG